MNAGRKLWIAGLCSLFAVLIATRLATAQSPNGWTLRRVNVRSVPVLGNNVIAVLEPDTPLVLEGRSVDSLWLLGSTLDTGQHGWMSRQYIRLLTGLHIADLPVASDSGIAVAAAAGPQPTRTYIIPTAAPGAVVTAWAPPEIPSEVMKAAHLQSPILPMITSQLHASIKRIFARGQELGNDPAVFAKVGDCMTDAYFMDGLGTGNYDLGRYSDLDGVIRYFSAPVPGETTNSFTTVSQASYSGLTANTVLSGEFTSVKGAGVCQENESMLRCEYRLHKPSYAIIMLGFSETQLMEVRDFDILMRKVVQQSIERGVIPILSTFPENQGRKQVSRLMNKAIVEIGHAFGVPVINLDRALYSLPDHGVDSLSHLTIAPVGTSNFTGVGLRYGMNMRNLLTLQALDIVWKDLQKP